MVPTGRCTENIGNPLAREILNSHGLPVLPNELYSEILSYFEAMPMPQWFDERTDPYRHVTLLALSQTCRSLRSFFLRYAWERVEVFGGMWTPAGMLATEEEQGKHASSMNVRFVEEVLHQLRTVTERSPELGKYVRIVNIMFGNLDHKDIVIRELAQDLSLLPHVHTLQLSSNRNVFIPTNFPPNSYPQIHTLCLRQFTHRDILPACPNVRTLIQHDSKGRFPWRQSETGASHIEVLGVLSTVLNQISLQSLISPFASDFPHLRDLTVDRFLLRSPEVDLSCLCSLPLHTLRLYLTGDRWAQFLSISRFLPATDAECEEWIELAKKILKKCPGDAQKRVVVVRDGKLECHQLFA